MTDTQRELTAMEVVAIEQQGGPGWPTAQPAAGQSDAEWRDQIARLRARHDAMALENERRFLAPPAPVLPMASVVYRDIEVDAGTISARVYTPHGDGPHAGIVLFHGGAFWMGGGTTAYELNDAYSRHTAEALGAVVLNVDYRLAPEHPCPTQLEDGYAALLHVRDHADELAIDPARLGVLGISSGGLLAAGITHLTQERGGPKLALQILLAPLVDLGHEPADPLMKALGERLRDLYVHDAGIDVQAPAYSPLRAPDVSGIPPTVIVTGATDPLGEQGRAYAARLASAGIPGVGLDYPMGHTDATSEQRSTYMAEMLSAARPFIEAT